MGAVYGILGGAEPGEMEAMSARLAHRGAESAEWSPVSGRLARRARLGPGGALQSNGAVAFDGAIDNRSELTLALGRSGDNAEPTGDGPLAGDLWAAFGEEGLARIAGQFALVLWDTQARRLVLARDRVGYAPLYIALVGERLLFASEYKALLAIAGVPARPNRAAIQTIQNTKWVRPGVTCLEGIHPVAPGTWIEVEGGRMATPALLGHTGPGGGRGRQPACGPPAPELPGDAAPANRALRQDRRLAERRPRFGGGRRGRARGRRRPGGAHHFRGLRS